MTSQISETTVKIDRGPSVRLPGESLAAATRRLGYQPRGKGFDDRRGNPTDRKNRKLKIIGALPIRRGARLSWGGDGRTVPCVHCKTTLTYATLTVDRIDPYGSYALINCQASCGRCNTARGDDVTWQYDPKIHLWGPAHSDQDGDQDSDEDEI